MDTKKENKLQRKKVTCQKVTHHAFEFRNINSYRVW